MSSLHTQHQRVVTGDMLSAVQERTLLGHFHSDETKQNMPFVEECKEFSLLLVFVYQNTESSLLNYSEKSKPEF